MHPIDVGMLCLTCVFCCSYANCIPQGSSSVGVTGSALPEGLEFAMPTASTVDAHQLQKEAVAVEEGESLDDLMAQMQSLNAK